MGSWKRRARAAVIVASTLSVLSVTGAQARDSVSQAESQATDDDADPRGRLLNHSNGGVEVDLSLGEDRGVATSKLTTGVLDPQNDGANGKDPAGNPNDHVTPGPRDVYFVISDASDREFAEEFNATWAPALDFGLKNLTDGVENYVDGTLDDSFGFDEETGQWKFAYHPGRVATGQGDSPGARGTSEYAPLKVIEWKGRTVVVNAPFVNWGDPADGHELVVDDFEGQGNGCVPEIRASMPLQSYDYGLADTDNGGPGLGGGPIALGDRPGPGGDEIGCQVDESPNDRYKGGQAVDIDLDAMTVGMKLHLALFDAVNPSYYTVFDTSGLPDAEFMGVIHSARSSDLGRSTDSAAVGNIEQWANGILWDDGGPDRFQPGIPDYPGGSEAQAYTPMWHITWLFWNCNGDDFTTPPYPNGTDPGGQPLDTQDDALWTPPATEDDPNPQPVPEFMRYRFMVNQLAVDCEDDARRIAAEVTGNNQGVVEYGDVDELVDAGHLLRTNAPPGNFPSTKGVDPAEVGPVNPPLPVVPVGNPGSVTNCPIPVTVELDRGTVTPRGVAFDGEQHADLDGIAFGSGDADFSQEVITEDLDPRRGSVDDDGRTLQGEARSALLFVEDEVVLRHNGEEIARLTVPKQRFKRNSDEAQAIAALEETIDGLDRSTDLEPIDKLKRSGEIETSTEEYKAVDDLKRSEDFGEIAAAIDEATAGFDLGIFPEVTFDLKAFDAPHIGPDDKLSITGTRLPLEIVSGNFVRLG